MCADWLIYPMILLEAVAKNHTFHKFFFELILKTREIAIVDNLDPSKGQLFQIM